MTRESLEFHIRSNDYFGTLATVLDLLRQDGARGYTPEHDSALQRLRDDLLALQSRCRIIHWPHEPEPLNPPRAQKTP